VRTFRRAGSCAWRELGDELVVINLKNNVMYALNASARELWRTLEQPHTASSFVEGEAQPTVEGFLAELSAEGLLDISEDETPGDTLVQGGLPMPAPPKILWREPMQRFGANCGFRPGQGDPCIGDPHWS